MSVVSCPNYIHGAWAPARSGKTGRRENPAQPDEIVAEFAHSGADDLLAAVDAARAAQPAWRFTPAPRRGEILFRAWEILRRRAEEIAQALTREEGKVIAESRGELLKAINLLEFVAGEGRRLCGETFPSEMPATLCYTVRDPVGLVGVITPWNFPVAIPVWKIAPALVAGNAVIFKPSSLTPLTAKLVVEVFAEAGVPPGVLNLVYGPGSTVGQGIIDHPEVRALTFTGSNEIGTALYTQGAKLGKKVQCEMGGKNPVIVMDDADLDLAVAATVQGAFGSTGQRCTATSRVIAVGDAAATFSDKLAAAARGAQGTMGPMVERRALEEALAAIEGARGEGARVVVGGRRQDRPGYFLEPTVLDGCKPEMTIAQEEVFGPVIATLRARDLDEAIAIANGVRYGLSASIFTSDLQRAMRFCERIDVGIVHVNQPTIGGEAQIPFGGIKATGVGPREQGKTAIDFYTELKTVYLDYTGRKREGNLY